MCLFVMSKRLQSGDFYNFRKNLAEQFGQFDYYADKFDRLHMYFMNFYGKEDINKVIEVNLITVFFPVLSVLPLSIL